MSDNQGIMGGSAIKGLRPTGDFQRSSTLGSAPQASKMYQSNGFLQRSSTSPKDDRRKAQHQEQPVSPIGAGNGPRFRTWSTGVAISEDHSARGRVVGTPFGPGATGIAENEQDIMASSLNARLNPGAHSFVMPPEEVDPSLPSESTTTNGARASALQVHPDSESELFNGKADQDGAGEQWFDKAIGPDKVSGSRLGSWASTAFDAHLDPTVWQTQPGDTIGSPLKSASVQVKQNAPADSWDPWTNGPSGDRASTSSVFGSLSLGVGCAQEEIQGAGSEEHKDDQVTTETEAQFWGGSTWGAQ